MSTLDKDMLELVSREGLRFLQAMAEAYGSERAQEVWATISTSLGNDVRDAVFLAMLCGEGSTRFVEFSAVGHNLNNKIAAIKAIRANAGLGLKEAKDLIDAAAMGRVKVECGSASIADDLRRELRTLGVEVR